MYKLYSVGASTETCDTPACISLGVDNSPSTETLDFLLVKYELMSFVKFAGNCNFDILYSTQGMPSIPRDFLISGILLIF
jgi:hypothetical protein